MTTSTSHSSTFNLAALDGVNGFVINGITAGDRSGIVVSNAGDVNQDGIEDVIIGTVRGNNNGRAYVLFGQPSGFSPSFSLSNLNGSNGFTILGLGTSSLPLLSVSRAGDLNSDGIEDLALGVPGAAINGTQSGRVWAVLGRTGDFPATLTASTFSSNDGFAIDGAGSFHEAGAAIAPAGDINGDGIDDLLIGAPRASVNSVRTGRAFVVFGRAGGFNGNVNLGTLNGSNGFAINGVVPLEAMGRSLSPVGDINGDGFGDLIFGAPAADQNGTNAAGRAYLLLGRADGFAGNVNLADLNGTNGFAIAGMGAYSFAGTHVSGAGDINGDGFDDIVVTTAEENRANAYIVFGQAAGFGSSLSLSSINGNNGFIITGARSIQSIKGTGDINGDGIDDLLLTFTSSNQPGGQAAIIYGRRDASTTNFAIASLNGTNGFVIQHPTVLSDSDVADFNNDGTPDLILGSSTAAPVGADSGQSAVVFRFADAIAGLSFSAALVDASNVFQSGINNGINANLSTGILQVSTASGLLRHSIMGFNDIIGTDLNDGISGNGNSNTLSGGLGNDNLRGQGGNDVLVGGTGDDTLGGGQGDDLFAFDCDNLLGTDTISDTFGSNTLDFSATSTLSVSVDLIQLNTVQVVNAHLQIILSGAASNLMGGSQSDTLVGNLQANTLSGNAGADWLRGADGADLLLGGNGRDTLQGGRGADTLTGGIGSDTLTGGFGLDRFRFDLGAVFDASLIGVDTIMDFTTGQDLILLSQPTFTALSSNLSFATVQTETQAQTSTALITYIQSTGSVYYNQNGTAVGFGNGGQFVDLTDGLIVTVTDFQVVA